MARLKDEQDSVILKMHAICLCLKGQNCNIWECLCELWSLKVLRRDILELLASIFKCEKTLSAITLWKSPTNRGPFIETPHISKDQSAACFLFTVVVAAVVVANKCSGRCN